MELRLSRCTVRPWREADAPSLALHANDRRISVNLRDGFPHPYKLADAEAFIRFAVSGDPQTMFAIEVGGRAVGGIGFSLRRDVERVSAEIGYWVGAAFWGQGIATEALAAVTRYAVDTHGLTRVYAVPYEWNGASFRVLEKAGYVREGRMRRSAIKDGRVIDQLLYAYIEPDRSGGRPGAGTVKGAEVEPYVTVENIGSKARSWLERIRPYNQHELKLNAAASALLVVDMQRFFLDPASPTFACGAAAIVPTVKRLIEAFRRAGRPVIFTRHVHHPGDLDSGIMGWWWEGKCLEGSPESEIDSDLAPAPGEKVVFKHRYSAFYNTDLETVLRCLKVEDVVIAGVMTNMCCESTARDAYYRDLKVFFPADGTGTISEEMHLASLLNLAYGFAFVPTGDAIVAQLEGGSASVPAGGGRG